MDGKIDAQAEVIHEVKTDVREVKVIANSALTESKKTNGRVTRIEEREAEARGAAAEHRRMEDVSDHKSEKWKGILPAIIAGAIASIISGLTVALTLLAITGQL
jgi:hypothetical protein